MPQWHAPASAYYSPWITLKCMYIWHELLSYAYLKYEYNPEFADFIVVFTPVWRVSDEEGIRYDTTDIEKL